MMHTLSSGYRAVVFGASGGIGAALVQLLADDAQCTQVFAGARVSPASASVKITPFAFDLLDESTIRDAATLVTQSGPPDLVIVATGLLHDGALQPEKTLRALNAKNLLRSYQINTVGPALIAKHMVFRLPRDRRAIFAALTARVGSITDNRKGGWHSYRASKAALNQLIRTASIELALKHPQALCVGLHPGTVNTRMSTPFQAAVPAAQLFSAAQSAAHLLRVLDGLAPAQSGRVFAWDGQEVPA
jgi:NAD(P)-dependent dehydrogenase (short-subunit alcohol dehydrogenase family)